MAVEQKFKVLQKAKIEIYQNMNQHLRDIEKNSAEFRELADNSGAWSCDVRLLWYLQGFLHGFPLSLGIVAVLKAALLRLEDVLDDANRRVLRGLLAWPAHRGHAVSGEPNTHTCCKREK